MGIVLSFYVGSYFLCVSQGLIRLSGGDQGVFVPGYHYLPKWLRPEALYRPIHLLDRNCLRRFKWQTPPTQSGELVGPGAGPHRVLLSIPYTNAP